MQALGQLTGGIAHDFNNLLTVIQGSADILTRDEIAEDRRKRFARAIVQASENAAVLTSQLLAFARRQPLKPELVDLSTLVRGMADLIDRTMGERIRIETDFEGTCPVTVDRNQLQSAILNVASNARDAMPDGGTVTILAENRKVEGDELAGLSGDFVRLAVADNGTGISGEDLEKVMEPFFTTKDVGKGSGLGLSMVYGFAKQSNGAFRLRSQLGSGTTAELWLPRAPTGAKAAERPRKEEPSRKAGRKLRVLLVDDHAEVRNTTAALLADLGHAVIEAANGPEALKTLQDGDCGYDLMISDYAMPQQSGTEFLREARQFCPGVPALIITGYAEADAISDRPEGVEVLLKPFTPNKLEAALSRVCDAAVAR
jgi:CheY-like chemotaxis protein